MTDDLYKDLNSDLSTDGWIFWNRKFTFKEFMTDD